MTVALPAVVAGSVGVLGGTFDPIHVGHLAIAEAARECLGLERVVFVPAGEPPHKPGRVATPAADRAAMVELAVARNPVFEVSRIELEREGPSYSVETMDAFVGATIAAGRTPDFTFILSAEAFRDILTWREPRRLLELARIAIVPRDDVPAPSRDWLAEHFAGLEDRVVALDGPHVGLSASEIRALAAAGRSIRYLVPDAVAEYASNNHLYLPAALRTI